jgi:DNA polymerase I-like protein with 3'-5' exonuclease and polymerase domains
MREIAMIMEDCIDATVPFKVDIAVGDNWGQID